MEEGVVILPAYIERGVLSLVDPVSGYLILVSKLVLLLGLKLSAAWALEIAVALSVAFSCPVVVAIALSPTHLRWPFLCALAVLIVPTGPDVFGVPLMTFWWAGFLPILALLWDHARGRQGLRYAFIVIGGLSSPLIVPVAALQAVRALCEREKAEYRAAVLATVIAAVQIVAIARSPEQRLGGVAHDVASPLEGLNVFAGYAFFGPRYGAYFPSGLAVIALLVACAWPIRSKLTHHFALLTAMLFAVIVTSALRAGLDLHSPTGYGPRYFLYPYTTLAWSALWIAALSPLLIRAVLVGAWLAGPILTFRHLSATAEPGHWRERIAECVSSGQAVLPVPVLSYFEIWRVTLTRAQCETLIGRALFR